MNGLMGLKSLVVDASTNVFQAGILEEDHFLEFFSTTDDTLTGFFDLLLQTIKSSVFEEVIFCQGPGKLLGIRATLMFVQVLKIVRPELSVRVYNSLALANKIQNPLPLDDLDWKDEGDNEEQWEVLAETLNDRDELDAIEFRRSLKKEEQEGVELSQRKFFEDAVCVRKNRTQYYIFSEGKITLIDHEALERQESPVYYLPTTHDASYDESSLIPMEYDLGTCAEFIRELSKPTELVVTEFDAQNEFKQWEPVRHH